jgi:hypothetical protein
MRTIVKLSLNLQSHRLPQQALRIIQGLRSCFRRVDAINSHPKCHERRKGDRESYQRWEHDGSGGQSKCRGGSDNPRPKTQIDNASSQTILFIRFSARRAIISAVDRDRLIFKRPHNIHMQSIRKEIPRMSKRTIGQSFLFRKLMISCSVVVEKVRIVEERERVVEE